MSVCAVCAVGRVDTVSRLQSAIQNNDPTGIEEAIGLSTLPAPVPLPVHLQTPPPTCLCSLVFSSSVWRHLLFSRHRQLICRVFSGMACILTKYVTSVRVDYNYWQTSSSLWKRRRRSPVPFRANEGSVSSRPGRRTCVLSHSKSICIPRWGVV
jgi:hypothetical protein